MDYFQGGEHRASLGIYLRDIQYEFVQDTLVLQRDIHFTNAFYLVVFHCFGMDRAQQGMPYCYELFPKSLAVDDLHFICGTDIRFWLFI